MFKIWKIIYGSWGIRTRDLSGCNRVRYHSTIEAISIFFFFFNFIHWLIMVFGSDYYNISWNITNDVLLYEDFILEYFPWFWEKKYFEMKKVEKCWKKFSSWYMMKKYCPNLFQLFSTQNIFFSQNQGKYSKMKSSYSKTSFVIFHDIL